MSTTAHFWGVWVVVVARGSPNHRKRAVTLIFGVVGGSGGQRKGQCPKTSVTARFRGDGGQRKTQPPKTSIITRFRLVWVVVVARGRPNHRKQAVMLIFRVVGGGGGQRTGPPRKRA